MLPLPVWVVPSLLASPYALDMNITANVRPLHSDARPTREDIGNTEGRAGDIRQTDTNHLSYLGSTLRNRVQQRLGVLQYLGTLASAFFGEVFFHNRTPGLGIWRAFQLVDTRACLRKLAREQCFERSVAIFNEL